MTDFLDIHTEAMRELGLADIAALYGDTEQAQNHLNNALTKAGEVVEILQNRFDLEPSRGFMFKSCVAIAHRAKDPVLAKLWTYSALSSPYLREDLAEELETFLRYTLFANK